MKHIIILIIFVFCTFVCFTFSQQPQQEEIDRISGCVDPQKVCSDFHPSSEITGYCESEQCIEINYGDKIKLAVTSELGVFPKVWFIEGENNLTLSPSPLSCLVTKRDKEILVEIPDNRISCMMALQSSKYKYFEHFTSNPQSPCLGWVECRTPAPGSQP